MLYNKNQNFHLKFWFFQNFWFFLRIFKIILFNEQKKLRFFSSSLIDVKFDDLSIAQGFKPFNAALEYVWKTQRFDTPVRRPSTSSMAGLLRGVPQPRKSDLAKNTPELAVLCPVLAILKIWAKNIKYKKVTSILLMGRGGSWVPPSRFPGTWN